MDFVLRDGEMILYSIVQEHVLRRVLQMLHEQSPELLFDVENLQMIVFLDVLLANLIGTQIVFLYFFVA